MSSMVATDRTRASHENVTIEYFDRAIARDPAFALAWANLAMAYTDLAEIGSGGA